MGCFWAAGGFPWSDSETKPSLSSGSIQSLLYSVAIWVRSMKDRHGRGVVVGVGLEWYICFMHSMGQTWYLQSSKLQGKLGNEATCVTEDIPGNRFTDFFMVNQSSVILKQRDLYSVNFPFSCTSIYFFLQL